jgi:hypothetical protein
LTEGVLDLKTAVEFLQQHKIPKGDANTIVRTVAHIPLGAQTLCDNFNKLPKAGDVFRNKTDLWPMDPSEVATASQIEPAKAAGPGWL